MLDPTTGIISGRPTTAGAYSVTVTATNRGGTGQATLSWTVTGDTAAPSVPTALQAGNVGAQALTLTWTASTDNAGVAGYEVSRNGTTVGTTSVCSFASTGLTAGSNYSFTVRARDAAGNWSAWSSPLTVTTSTDVQAPALVGALGPIAAGANTLVLTWDGFGDNVGIAGYNVYRNGVLIGSTTELVFCDTGLSASTAYTYTVKAFDAAGNLSSATVAVTVSTTAASGSDTNNDGVPDAVETRMGFNLGAPAAQDNANILQLNIQRPTR